MVSKCVWIAYRELGTGLIQLHFTVMPRLPF